MSAAAAPFSTSAALLLFMPLHARQPRGADGKKMEAKSSKQHKQTADVYYVLLRVGGKKKKNTFIAAVKSLCDDVQYQLVYS